MLCPKQCNTVTSSLKMFQNDYIHTVSNVKYHNVHNIYNLTYFTIIEKAQSTYDILVSNVLPVCRNFSNIRLQYNITDYQVIP